MSTPTAVDLEVISRQLLANLGITPATGGACFAGYGADTGPRWKTFGEAITAAEKFGGEDEIVASATRTFETLERWLFRDKTRCI